MGMAWCMVLPGGHGMGKGMAWWAWHSIWYGLAMHGMVLWYSLAMHGMVLWYSLAGMASYLVWPGGYGVAYGMAWWA